MTTELTSATIVDADEVINADEVIAEPAPVDDMGNSIPIDNGPSGEPGPEAVGAGNDEVDSRLTIAVDGKDYVLTKQDMYKISKTTGVSSQELTVAWASVREYRLHFGCLQQYRYSYQSSTFEWFTVVPEGGWKSLRVNGQTRRHTLRKFVVLLFP